MGRILTPVTVANFAAPEWNLHFDALVDTGAYCLTLPAVWKEKLGPLAQSVPVRVEMADHRVFEGELCGPVAVTIDGFGTAHGDVLFIDMEPEDGRYEPLLGYITLEQARIAVDMVGHRLVRLPHVDVKGVGSAGALAAT